MAAVILLDTHILVWLYQDPLKFLPPEVRRRLDEHALGLSPFARLELQYLHEVGKLGVPASTITDYLVPQLEMTVTDPSAASVCQAALGMDWTRDPFDRLLSAQAVVTNCELVTKDRRIRNNLSLAWWN
jgi:PIN domain nuclease of toxin-antitoxin system